MDCTVNGKELNSPIVWYDQNFLPLNIDDPIDVIQTSTYLNISKLYQLINVTY